MSDNLVRETQLSEIALLEMGQSPPSEVVSEGLASGLPFLQGNAEFSDLHPAPRLSCNRPQKVCNPGDALISVRAPVGAINVADQKYCIGRGLAAVRFLSAHPPFGIHALRFIAPTLRRVSQGTTFEAIGRAELGQLRLSLPSVPEQVKIAEILDTVDATIRKTEQLIAKLEQVKQGLLHDLLTRGIDDNGELRDPNRHPEQFKETVLGRIPRDWDVCRLEDLADNHDGKRIPLKQADRDQRHGRFPYYGASGIIDSIDNYIFDGDFVLLGEDGENVISRQLPLTFRVSGRFWVNNHAHVLLPRSNVDIDFLVELLEATNYTPIVSGSAQPKLTQKALSRLQFRLPRSPEQQRIAIVLDAHRGRTETELRELSKLRLLKLGLMDDLLTGRVRVTHLLEKTPE